MKAPAKAPAKGAGGGTAAPSKGAEAKKSAVPAVPPKPGLLGTTVVPTTEAELLRLMGAESSADSGLIDVNVVAGFIRAQDWAALVKSLQSSPVGQAPLVKTIVSEVLGPIAEAQGIAKAVIGVAAAVVDMYLTAKANNVRCQKLGRQLGDIEPALRHLKTALDGKASAMLGSAVPTAPQSAQLKREVESLKRPLETLQVTARAVEATITEWAAKGQRLFGAVRQMMQAKNFGGMFAEHAADIASGIQGLQAALAAMTFINLNEVQQVLQKLPGEQAAVREMRTAAQEDAKMFEGKMKELVEKDGEFKAAMDAQFGDLQTFLTGEFRAVVKKLDDIVIGIEKIGGMSSDVSEIKKKVQVLADAAGRGAVLVVDVERGLEQVDVLIKLIKKVTSGGSGKDGDELVSRVFQDMPAELRRCRDLVAQIGTLGIRTAFCAQTLKHFSEDAERFAAAVSKWHAKASGRTRFFNMARMSRVQDFNFGLHNYQDSLMQVLQQTEQGLKEARCGTFRNYVMVKNKRAREFWEDNFTGRAEVPWGEFQNMMRWQEPFAGMDDKARARMWYWLKRRLDENGDHRIHIGEWNQYTAAEAGGDDYEKAIVALAETPVPDEDELDRDGEGPSPAAKRAVGIESVHRNPLIRMGGDVRDEDLRALGLHSGRRHAAGVVAVDVAFVVDCTGTMRGTIETLQQFLPTLADDLVRRAAGAAVRIAFVGYRDEGDDEPLSVLPFTCNVERAVEFIAKEVVASGGGGDAAEDVFSGLERAGKLDWTFGDRVVRHLVHVADAPSHGTRYHTFADRTLANGFKDNSWHDRREAWDRMAEFDADGRHGEALLSGLAKRRIDYTFVEIYPFTRKMTDQFKSWYDAHPEKNLPFSVLPMGQLDALRSIVAERVQVSISSARK